MQVARLQHSRSRGYLRKALEAVTAWITTGRYGRSAVRTRSSPRRSISTCSARSRGSPSARCAMRPRDIARVSDSPGDTFIGVPGYLAPQAPALFGTALPHIEITSPEAGLRLLLDPETPPALNTLALRAVADPTVTQLVWYVDGRPFQTVDVPFELRWPLAAGEHTFQARIPFTAARSRAVTVIVE